MCIDGEIISINCSQVCQWPGLASMVDDFMYKYDCEMRYGIYLPNMDEPTLKNIISWKLPLDSSKMETVESKFSDAELVNLNDI